MPETKKQAVRAKTRGIESDSNTIVPIETEEDTEHYTPTVFIPLDMPELTGRLNILCTKGG